MIETHVHILPQIDDGPQDFPESLSLAKAFVQTGYKNIITTPHFWKGYWEPTKKEIQDKIKILNNALKELKWHIKVYPGSEVRLTDYIFEQKPLEQFQSLNNSRYLLVDVYPDITTETISQLEYLLKNNLRPILAHPERYPCLYNLDMVKKIKSLGVLFQLTSVSLIENNRKITNQAELFLKNGYYDLIGSDSHNSQNRFYPLTKVESKIKSLIGLTKWQLLSQTNCANILNDSSF